MALDAGDVFLTAVAFLAIVITYGTTKTATDNTWRQQIVAHGCAEYYADANGAAQWRWK